MNTTTTSGYDVNPLTGSIGAEIAGIRLDAPLEDAEIQFIHNALLEWGVVFFRDQPMSLDDQVRFGSYFGELVAHPAAPPPPGFPEVMVIHTDENSTYVNGERWHSDVTPAEEPPMGSILRMETVPPKGGDTLFANMGAVYDDLSEPIKDLLSGLTATHGAKNLYAGRYRDDDPGIDLENSHPIVRVHPDTGRKSLYVNETFTRKIDRLEPDEGAALLGMLYNRVRHPKYHCRFRWAPNSVAFWDNRAVQHTAVWDYYPEVRHGFRVTLRGDKPRGST